MVTAKVRADVGEGGQGHKGKGARARVQGQRQGLKG